MIGINYVGKRKERLANQMFQYAAVKGIAKNRGYNWCVPPSNWRSSKDDWEEHQLFQPFKLTSMSPLQIQRIDDSRPIVEEKSFHFDEELYNNCPDFASLLGFFQSEKYFLNVREELLEEYLEKEFPSDKFEAVKKGQKGGDIIQSVVIKGEPVGSILYESKDVLNFDEKWVQKLLNDMSKVDATVGFIFTKAMPKKSKGFVEEREGGRVIICSEYPILRQLVSTTRKLIQANKANIASNKDEISPKLKDLFNYLNSNEFRIQTRKIFNGIKKDGEQIDKDERSGENQIKNRRKNLEDSKKNINGVITSLVSNAGLSDDILDGDDDDLLPVSYTHLTLPTKRIV